LRPVYDGYVSGRGRNLTEDPKTPNDLALTEKAVGAFRRPLHIEGKTPFAVQYLQSEKQTMLGVLVRPAPEINLRTARFLPRLNDQPALLLLEILRETQRAFWKVPLNENGAPEAVEDAEALIRQRLGLKKRDSIPSEDVFQSQSIRWAQAESQRVGGILVKAFDAEKPQLMGVAIPGAVLRARGYALQTDDYLRAPEIIAALQRPHDILLKIYDNQRELEQCMENLAGWLMPERPKELDIPAPVIDKEHEYANVLNEAQKRILRWVEHKKEGESAKPFTLEDISKDESLKCSEDEMRLALEIFEAMGLIVPIMLKNPASDQRMNFYRLAEESDIWAGAEGEEV
jgi:hypothetical protein